MRRRRADEVRPQGVHSGAHAAADDRGRRVRAAPQVKRRRLTHSSNASSSHGLSDL